MRLRIKSLQQRVGLFLLLPVALLLFGIGLSGFIFAKDTMLKGWKEAALLKLQRAAHHIDMRLERPIEWIEMFHKTGGAGEGFASPQWILQQLKTLEGVAGVDLEWKDGRPQDMPMQDRGLMMGGWSMMRFRHAKISRVTTPQYDTTAGQETVSLISQLKDESGTVLGTLDVAVRFDYLMRDIRDLGWWQSDLAYLVDDAGHIIGHTKSIAKGRKRLGEKGDLFELAVLEAMQKTPSGTLLGPGHPSKHVSGFYRLENAPWTVVLFAPGEKILAPIHRFLSYSALAGGLCILLITLLIYFVVGRKVRAINKISGAAERVAKGEYGGPLPIKGHDEIGHLTESFNTMVNGLKEKDFISNTFGRYVDQEIARDLMRRPEASRLGGEKREVVILMSDIRNFTPLSETLNPEETIQILNHYFSRMIEIIQRHRGIIVDFFGDALLVFFDPLERPIAPSIQEAVLCAFEMQEDIARFNEENRDSGLPELEMGLGINAGEVVVGNIGSTARAKYGIVGAPVNLTNRIQSVAKANQVVVSDSVYQYGQKKLSVRKSLTVDLKGVSEPVVLHLLNNLSDRS